MNSNSEINVDPLSSCLEAQIRSLIDNALGEDPEDKSVEIMPLALTEWNGYRCELLAILASLVPGFQQLFADILLIARCKDISIESTLHKLHKFHTELAGLNGLDDAIVVKREGELDKCIHLY